MLTIPVAFGFAKAFRTTNGFVNSGGGSAKNTNTATAPIRHTKQNRIFGGSRKIHPLPCETSESPNSPLLCPTSTSAKSQWKPIVVSTKDPNSMQEALSNTLVGSGPNGFIPNKQ